MTGLLYSKLHLDISWRLDLNSIFTTGMQLRQYLTASSVRAKTLSQTGDPTPWEEGI